MVVAALTEGGVGVHGRDPKEEGFRISHTIYVPAVREIIGSLFLLGSLCLSVCLSVSADQCTWLPRAAPKHRAIVCAGLGQRC